MKILIITTIILICGIATAGDMTPPAGPEDPASAMFTVDDIYNRLNEGAQGAMRTTSFTEPVDGPGSTGHTLTEIMDKAPTLDDVDGAASSDVAEGKTFWGLTNGEWGLRNGTDTGSAHIAKTGQTKTFETGDDGELEKGLPWPNPRFTDNGDGTVSDNMTDLIWLKDAGCYEDWHLWSDAIIAANSLANGACGLSDGSTAGDWRLPNIRELASLVDIGNREPAIPTDHPFENVHNWGYWSSTTTKYDMDWAWRLNLYEVGDLNTRHKSNEAMYLWPVRGGH